MACASTVAVVVPSPATSEVFEATSFTICAPMFSNLFSSSISLATVTPSLVIVGEPKLFSMTTLRPFGPSVTFTASARVLTPLRIASRARWSNRISLADICESPWVSEGGGPPPALSRRCPPNAVHGDGTNPTHGGVGGGLLALDDAEDVLLAHDEVLLAVDLDLGTGVLREEDAIAGLDVERTDVAILQHLAVADGEHLALDRLLLGRVGDDDAPLGLLFLGDALHDDAVLERTDLHMASFGLLSVTRDRGHRLREKGTSLAVRSVDCQRRRVL